MVTMVLFFLERMLAYVFRWATLAAYTLCQSYNTFGVFEMRVKWLHAWKRFRGVVTISAATKCTYGRRASCRVMFFATVGHAGDVIGARVVSSLLKQAATPASASIVRHM